MKPNDVKRPNEYFAESRDGTRISYVKSGSGELVITIFGATCFKDYFPVRTDVKELSRHFTVINYDRRGRGGSLEHSSWSIQQEVEDVEAIIDDNGGSAYLYGHSSGAVIALESALALGKKVKGVMIYDASYVSSEAEKRAYAFTKARIEDLLKQAKNAKAIKTFLAEIGMPKAFVYLLPLLPGWKQMKQLAPTLIYDITLTEDLPPIERLQSITVPVLVLAGGRNPGSIKDVYSQLSGGIPNNQHHLLEGQDHMASMKTLVPYMQKFLK